MPLSYRLHAELAAEHGGAERWGYRRVNCGQISAVVRKADLNGNGTSTPRKSKSRVATPVKQGANGAGGGGLTATPTELNGSSSPNGRPPQRNQQQQDGNGKDWEKLPKQNKKAAALLRESKLPPDLDWFNGDVVQEFAEMGLPGFTETAQVHPLHFTYAMATLARDAGADIRVLAQATGIGLNQAGTAVTSVGYADRARGDMAGTLHGVTDVVVAAGPWTGRVLPRAPVEGLRAHSVVFAAAVSPWAVFTNITLPADWVPPHRARGPRGRRHRGPVDPEVYARPNGEVYACGEPDRAVPLPDTADLVRVDEAQCDDMVSYLATVSPALAAAPVIAKQACYMPQHASRSRRNKNKRGGGGGGGDENAGGGGGDDGEGPGGGGPPIVGPAANVAGLWVASAHTCWGIQNAPGTGKLMSEFIFEGRARSADIRELDPRLFGV